MYQTGYFNLYVFGNIVETDYFIFNEDLSEYEISKKILKKYKDDLKKNYIDDFKIEIFHIEYYNENYNDIKKCLDFELKVIKNDINKINNYKKEVFDFSDLKDVLYNL